MLSSICWMPRGCSLEKKLDEVREIAFEIGLLGQYGLDINDHKETHVLRALPWRTFSALELQCIRYVVFKML